MGEDRWLNCRLQDIQERLEEKGYQISQPVISRFLKKHNYRLRVNAKQKASKQHPDRDIQFKHIKMQRHKHQLEREPVISVDTKKKELIGNFKNAGRIWCQQAEQVNLYDFPSDAEGKAVPYGVYDLTYNLGTVYVGQSADTSEFAVDNIAQWCLTEMKERFPKATKLMIEADGGGSNGYRTRLWKLRIQEKIADSLGLIVTVCHYPTGASKWNPIEHRLFSEISKTWAGCPLRSFELVLHYIRQAKTLSGLAVSAHLNTKTYKTGLKVSDDSMNAIHLVSHETCPKWNYSIYPRKG